MIYRIPILIANLSIRSAFDRFAVCLFFLVHLRGRVRSRSISIPLRKSKESPEKKNGSYETDRVDWAVEGLVNRLAAEVPHARGALIGHRASQSGTANPFFSFLFLFFFCKRTAV